MKNLGFHCISLSFSQATLYFPSAVSHASLSSKQNASHVAIPLWKEELLMWLCHCRKRS